MKPLSVAGDDLNKFINYVVRGSVAGFQQDLGSTAISPVDEGRLRSNWFASVGTNEKTTDNLNSPQTDAEQLPLDWRKKYHLVNNLPYAERLAFGNYAVNKPKNWFRAYFDAQGQNVVDSASRAAQERL